MAEVRGADRENDAGGRAGLGAERRCDESDDQAIKLYAAYTEELESRNFAGRFGGFNDRSDGGRVRVAARAAYEPFRSGALVSRTTPKAI